MVDRPTTNGRVSGYSAFFALDVPDAELPVTPPALSTPSESESDASAIAPPPGVDVGTPSIPMVPMPNTARLENERLENSRAENARFESYWQDRAAAQPASVEPAPEVSAPARPGTAEPETSHPIADFGQVEAPAPLSFQGVEEDTEADRPERDAADVVPPEAEASEPWMWPSMADASMADGPHPGDASVADASMADESRPEDMPLVGEPVTPLLPDRSASAHGDFIPTTFATSSMLDGIEALDRAELRSTTGVRGALNKVGFKFGLSPAEKRTEERRGHIRRQIAGTYQIAVISVKGGVGRTTTTAALGSVFASLRADRVVAIDANPDFGDLSTRVGRHPYGLTLRDLAHAPSLDSFAAVQTYTTTNSSNLDVVASAWTTNANEALTAHEYTAGINILRRHYSVLLADCGTGVLDSATVGALTTSHAVVVVTPATVGGVHGAVATLNWLHSHGLQHLTAKSLIAIVGLQPGRPQVELSAIEKVFASAQRPTHSLPYDPHLAEGGTIDLRLIEDETLLALEELAAAVAEGFPGFREAARR